MTTPVEPVTSSNDTSSVLLGVTHYNKDAELLRLTEMQDGTFVVVTQNKVSISSFVFPQDTPPGVTTALRALQVAMQQSNVEGYGGGVNHRHPITSKEV